MKLTTYILECYENISNTITTHKHFRKKFVLLFSMQRR